MKIMFYRVFKDGFLHAFLSSIIILSGLPSLFWSAGVIYLFTPHSANDNKIFVIANIPHLKTIAITLFLISIIVSCLSYYCERKICDLSTTKVGGIVKGIYFYRYLIGLLLISLAFNKITTANHFVFTYYLLIVISAGLIRNILKSINTKKGTHNE